MKMTNTDWLNYIHSDTCCICKKKLYQYRVDRIYIEIESVIQNNQTDVLPHRSETQIMDKVRHHYHGDSSIHYEPAR